MSEDVSREMTDMDAAIDQLVLRRTLSPEGEKTAKAGHSWLSQLIEAVCG